MPRIIKPKFAADACDICGTDVDKAGRVDLSASSAQGKQRWQLCSHCGTDVAAHVGVLKHKAKNSQGEYTDVEYTEVEEPSVSDLKRAAQSGRDTLAVLDALEVVPKKRN